MKERSRKAAIAAAALVAVAVLAALYIGAALRGGSHKIGEIYLYGETHSAEAILHKEAALWDQYYHEEGMRDLFIESAYFEAEWLNLWMKAEDDTILDALYEDWQGTASYFPPVREFYKTIKETCPETVFHGTDVGHQYDTAGQRYLEYLETNGLTDSEQYRRTLENIEQGKRYYQGDAGCDELYRENVLAENFRMEYDRLDGADVMGIYGSAHTGLDGMDFSTGTVPCMANQLKADYGEHLHSQSMLSLAEPLWTEEVEAGGRTYTADYFGKANASNADGYQYWECWRLEDAYENLSRMSAQGIYPAEGLFPIQIEEKQVYVLDHTKPDGTVERYCYRIDRASRSGELLANELWTEGPA